MKKLLSVAPFVLLLVACGGANPTAQPTAGQSPTAAPPTQGGGPAIACLPGESNGDGSATIVDFAFQPAQVTVSVGQSVAWTHNGEFPHTVTFDDGPDCGRLNAGESVAAEFSAAGTYAYHCSIHPTMRGSVTVNP